ncbi:MAG: DNA cytosine methyltransferase [Candidatus Nanopelagicales bacterium]
MAIPIVDLFAGPGGLNEGFSSFTGGGSGNTFQTIASFEMDSAACDTLTIRGAYRRLKASGDGLESYYRLLRGEATLESLLREPRFREAINGSRAEVHRIELGAKTRRQSNMRIATALDAHAVSDDSVWALVGGPPCQAYSLAGRSRRANDATFEEDKKHFLYREYLNILATFRPPIFVMENVKGLLSSTHAGTGMFERILKDLSRPSPRVGYSIHSFTQDGDSSSLEPDDFIIRAEDYGIPQRRHRVILLGMRDDLQVGKLPMLTKGVRTTVKDAIADLPPLRSGISKGSDSLEEWLAIRGKAALNSPRKKRGRPRTRLERGCDWQPYERRGQSTTTLNRWVIDDELSGIPQHVTRRHMEDDLVRYWYAANFALGGGFSPKLSDFPRSLLPRHANASSENQPFEDRFRVQLWNRPSTTVVSHIAKDGHYYIHPDPDQMRSLTVREAARLQTFPDNYLFMGNRTNQYSQVGNAVPPLLAHQIAAIIAKIAASL